MRTSKFIHCMAIFLAALACTGCKEEGNLAEGNYTFSLKAHYLKISPYQYNFPASTNTTYGSSVGQGQITSTETPWKFVGMPEWLSVDVMSGNADQTVNFSAQDNPSADGSRTSVFYLQSTDPEWTYKTGVSVSQNAATPYVKLVSDKSTLSFAGSRGTQEISIESNCTPTVEVTSGSSWIQASLSSDKKTVSISVDENTSGSSRYGYVNVRASYDSSFSILVNQSMATMDAETSQLDFDNTAATYKLKITSEAAWTTYVSDSWISVSSTSGSAGTSQVEISVTPNTGVAQRDGYVNFMVGTSQIFKLVVHQKGIYIDAGEDWLDIPSTGDSRKLNVKSNTSWTVTSDSEWIKVSPKSASGAKEITVTIADNPSLSERSGYLTFVSDANNIKEKKLIRQAGKTFSVETTVVNFSDKSSTSLLDVNSDGAWNAVKQEDYPWFDITPVTADGVSKLQITVQENNSTEERTGYVNVSLYDKTYQVAVHQDSKYLNVNASALKFGSKGGNSEVEIATNEDWKATIENNASWLTMDKTEGTGDCKFNVTVSENATVNARKAYIDVVTSIAGTTRLNYEQAGRYLNVDKSDFTFFAKGGTSTLTTINTDGTFKISQEGEWFQINKLSDNTFTVTASENKTNSERTGSITIEVTDLVEGELKVVLPVMQVENGVTFTKGDFTSDKNWNLSEGHNATITVIGFSGDKSWNVNPNLSTTLEFTGYGNDSNWNKKTGSNNTITGTEFTTDSNWNKQ